MDEAITFWAIVGKVQTMADGGLRVYLDLPESAIMAAAELMACKRVGQVLNVTCEVREQVERGPVGDVVGAELSEIHEGVDGIP